MDRQFMKYITAALLIVICGLIGVILSRKLQDKPKTIPVVDLNQLPVIGNLGAPLGKSVSIQAVVVDGETLKDKYHSCDYLLKVTSVNGVPLESQPIMDFSLDHAIDVRLAEDNFALFLLKNNDVASSLTADQVRKLQTGYVGKEVSLWVYETGGFSGMPSDTPEDSAIWQDRGYGFYTHLEILKEIK